jgi:hypothetical protein
MTVAASCIWASCGGPALLMTSLTKTRPAWRAKGGAIGGFGGGWLEQPRPWRGAQWAGLSLGSAEPP